MSKLSEYFTEDSIVRLLCSYRAKHSHRRHKLHMMRDISLHESTRKIEVKKTNVEFDTLQKIFPTRRNWVKLNEKERKLYNNSIKSTSARLYKSYKFYKKKNISLKESTDWYQNLINLINEILTKVENLEDYKMQKPKVFGILKKQDKVKTEYRPIALYELQDRVISSLTSRYLTDFFDTYFFDCSFAFRSTKGDTRYTHHKSVEKIVEYRKQKDLIWVSECDIQKFFDSVNHDHITKVFQDHVKQIELGHGRIIDDKAIVIFKKFLESFAFNIDVYPKNDSKEWWKENNLKENGYFKWIEKILKDDYGKDYLKNRIGVPQGNAISCFISNLLLHNVDSKVRDVCKEIFYVRFCDDMILMHSCKDKCSEGLEVYKLELKKNFLSYHPPAECTNYLTKENWKKFWRESKSKEPYLWANPKTNNNAFPWLSFVGYQIKYDQDIRLRKDAIKKEKRKQVLMVENVLKAIGSNEGKLNETSRKSKRQIVFSLQTRLNSMSVGRIQLYNYKKGEQGLCWTNGFEMIKGKNNKSIGRQLKELDSFREKQIWRLRNQLNALSKKSDNPEFEDDGFYFGSPFSYHNYLNVFSDFE